MANTLKFGAGQWATKEGSTLAYNDENDNYKPLPFDFTRASNATVVNKAGLIETVGNGIPRIDFLGNTQGALKLEPQRSNLVPYSQEFTGWTLTNVVETPNALISPDGTQNASKFVTNSNGVDIKYASIPVIEDTTYTFSFYCNYIGGLGLQGRFYDNTNGANIEYYDYMSQLEEGKWKRVTRTFTTPIGCTNIQVWYLASSSSNPVTAYYWGAQLEEESYATSYIPTNGSSVTRLADTANGSGNSEVFNDSEGVLFADISNISENQTTTVAFSLSDGSTSNAVSVYYFGTSGLYYDIFNSDGTRSGNTPMTKIQQTYNNKISLKYKSGDIALWVNGFEVNTNVGTLSLNGLSELSFDYGNGGFPFYGKTKEIAYYDEILTDLELEKLTSYRSLNELVTELNLNTL